MEASSKELFNNVVALLSKTLAFGVPWPAINNCDLEWPLLHNAMNDFFLLLSEWRILGVPRTAKT